MSKIKLSRTQFIILEFLQERRKEAHIDHISKYCIEKREVKQPKNVINRLSIGMVKNKLITVRENKHKEPVFSITSKGKEEYNFCKKENPYKLPYIKVEQEETEEENRVNLPTKQKEANWMEFTTPVFVVANNQWEFYQKQGEDIQNIFSSLDEEEIKRMHHSKVMEHITAAMHNPDSKKEEKGSRVKFVDFKEEHKKNRLVTTERYTDVDANPHLRIMEMKLGGYSQQEIIDECTVRFKLKPMTIGIYVDQVLKDIKKVAKDIIQDSIISHSDRYESIYKWFRENGYDKMSIKVLERREKLIGLHDGENVNSIINNFISESSLQNKPKYDFNKLSPNELQELELLVNRTVIILKKE